MDIGTHLEEASEGGLISTAENAVRGVYCPIRCLSCGALHVYYAVVEESGGYERAMGPEVQFEAVFNASCAACEKEFEVVLDFSEYPWGAFSYVQVLREKGARPAHVGGLEAIAARTERAHLGMADMVERLESFEDALQRGELVETYQAEATVLDELKNDVARALELLREAAAKYVLVLGPYADPKDLERVQVAVRTAGYKPIMIRELPDAKDLDENQKVQSLSLMFPFAIMIDPKPAGHLIEIEIARHQRLILAHLFAEHPSTRMVGDLAEIGHIRQFAYGENLEAAVQEAIAWAIEKHAERKAKRKVNP